MVKLRINGSYWELKGNMILNDLAIKLENIDIRDRDRIFFEAYKLSEEEIKKRILNDK